MTEPSQRDSSRVATESDRCGFVDQVTQAFRFLEREFGFYQVSANRELVRYERGPIFVNIICEVGLNVLIGRRVRFRDGPQGVWKQLRHEWGVEFPLEYVALDSEAGEQLDEGRLAVKTSDDLEEQVPRLAAFVQRYARDLLNGDPDAYARLGRLGRERSRDLTRWAAGR